MVNGGRNKWIDGSSNHDALVWQLPTSSRTKPHQPVLKGRWRADSGPLSLIYSLILKIQQQLQLDTQSPAQRWRTLQGREGSRRKGLAYLVKGLMRAMMPWPLATCRHQHEAPGL